MFGGLGAVGSAGGVAVAGVCAKAVAQGGAGIGCGIGIEH